MGLSEGRDQDCSQTDKQSHGGWATRAFRLVLSLLMITLLLPQGMAYAAENEQSTPGTQQATPQVAAQEELASGATPDPQADDDAAEAAAEAASPEERAPASEGVQDSASATPPTQPEAQLQALSGAAEPAPQEEPQFEPQTEPQAEPREEGVFATVEQAAEAGAVSEVPADEAAYIEGEVIVVLAGEDAPQEELASAEDAITDISQEEAVEIEELAPEPDGSPAALVELPEDVTVEDALLQLANDESVAYAQPNFRYTLLEDTPPATALYVPNDPRIQPGTGQYRWWLEAVNAFDAWEYYRTNQGVTVAVIDTGAQLNHPDLVDNISPLAWDAVNNQPLQKSVNETVDANGGKLHENGGDLGYHGTHVAGIIAAQANNDVLGAGVSYNAKIMPIAVFEMAYNSAKNTYEQSASTGALRTAYDVVMAKRTEANIRVVNMSLGGYGFDDTIFHNKIKEAKAAGILTVCAAGNGADDGRINFATGDSLVCNPSDYEEVISVTSVNQSLGHSTFSDHNQYKDLAAPGETIFSTVPTAQYPSGFASLRGTSMAAPIVSGIAAILFARDSSFTPAQVQEILYKTATDLGDPKRDNYFGHGLVNAETALADYTVVYDPGTQGDWLAANETTGQLFYGAPTPAAPSNPPAKSGYQFVRWEPAISPAVTADVTYTAIWAPVGATLHTVTFNARGGSTPVPASVQVASGSTYGSLATTSRTNYTFEGWYTAADGGTLVTAETVVALSANQTLYAHWQKNASQPLTTYTVTFKDYNGTVLNTQTVEQGSAVTPPANPTRPHYAFTGWRVDSPVYTVPDFQNITSDLTVIATYEELEKYTVIFKDYAGILLRAFVHRGDGVNAPSVPPREGYTFIGWDKAFDKITSDLTVTAQYRINTYKVAFNANGGKVSLSSMKRNHGAVLGKLPTPVRSGYLFAGWYTSASGGQKLGSATKVTAAMTCFAHWTGWEQQKSTGKYYYYLNGVKQVNKALSIGGAIYVFSPTGVMRTGGWAKAGNDWYYLRGGRDGRAYTGWQQIDGSWHYFGSNGKMYTGARKIGSSYYVFAGRSSGRMLSGGWVQSGDAWYYLRGANDGRAYTGWQQIGGSWYYFGSNGKMYTGARKIGSSYYVFAGGNSGRMLSGGWVQSGDAWYYLRGANDGRAYTGWQQIGGSWYYLGKDGKMTVGWKRIGTAQYYFRGGSDGRMVTGTKTIGNITYKFASSGALISPRKN